MSPPAEVEHGFGVFPHRGLEIQAAQGVHVETSQGQRLLDAGGASYGTANVPHTHPRIQAALDEASPAPLHTSRTFANPQRSALVDELCSFAGPWAERVFLSNSGTEAIEAAIKAAIVHTEPERQRLVAFEGAFHGRSLGALAATHEPRYREPFQARLGESTFVPYGDVDALVQALGGDVAAVLVEPIQGEAGVRVPADGFLADVVEAAHEAGALAIVDEIQTGLARTGSPLAIHRGEDPSRSPVEPDLLCLAKSLAAGLPLGATIAHQRLPAMGRGQHGTTFGGSPLACRVAREVLSILEEEQLARSAQRTGQSLREGIATLEHPLVSEVRGRGLMIGIGLHVRATPVLQALQAQGVLALPGGNDAVRLLPPLTIEDEHVATIVDSLQASLDSVQQRYQERRAP